jgi:hypothetical protein
MPYSVEQQPNGKFKVKSGDGTYVSKKGLTEAEAHKQLLDKNMKEFSKAGNDSKLCTCGQEIDITDPKAVTKHLKSDEHLEGAGLMDWVKTGVSTIKNAFSKRSEFNNISTRTLKEYGECKVMAITVAKKPIMRVLDKVINFISFGKWQSLKNKYSFDQMMHLGMIIVVKTESGSLKNIMCEKVDAVTIQPKITINGEGSKYLQAPIQQGMYTLRQLIEKARQDVGDKTFFDYDGFKNNCQYFCSYILKAGHCYSDKVKEFVMQDVQEMAKEMPELSKRIMNGVTDLGQLANKWMGKGKVTGGKLRINPTDKTNVIDVAVDIPVDMADELAGHIIGVTKAGLKKHVKYSKTDTHHSYDYDNYLDSVVNVKRRKKA